MASARQDESWVGWFDFIPIVGSNKNAVEAIVSLTKGGYKDAAVKGALTANGFLADITTAEEARAFIMCAIKGTGKEITIEGAKAIAEKQATALAKHKAAKGIVDNFTRGELLIEEDESCPKRGHHVINNSVLKLFKQIIDRFIDKVGYKKFPELEGRLRGSQVYLAYTQPLDQRTTVQIRDKMVIHMNQVYIDVNSQLYGHWARDLVEHVSEFMKGIAIRDFFSPFTALTETIQEELYQINKSKPYVDPYALDEWLKIRHKWNEFERARQEIVTMFNRLQTEDEIIQWAEELLAANKS